MDFESIAQNVGTQISTVAKVPIPFLLAVLFSSWIIWSVLKHSYAVRLENAASIKDLLERQVQEYKDKLSGASPDEAKARMDALEARLDSLAPRTLSSDRRNQMLRFLDNFRGCNISIAYDAAVPDARNFAQSLIATFNSAGWRVTAPMLMGISNPPSTGVGVIVQDPQRLTEPQKAVCAALSAIELPFDVMNGLSDRGRMDIEVEIIVSQNLSD